MATITIKIESEDLARDVLAHLGYLPADFDSDIPDLVEVEDSTPIEECRAPKTHVEDILERMRPIDVSMPKPTRRMPDTPKQNAFCVTEDPKPEVEPVESELGAPLEVYSDETKKERDEIYKQCVELRKSLPSAEERLKAQVEELHGGDRLDHLDALADHPDKKMREAVKAYVLQEYPGRDFKHWPALKKIVDTE
jgi:hypothetical protein